MADEDVSKRPQFGTRFLTDPSQVYEHNAWDNVEWDAEQERAAQEQVDENSSHILPSAEQEKFEKEADQFWDKFYLQHQNRFFKDRHWLFTEFPELAEPVGKDKEKTQETPGESAVQKADSVTDTCQSNSIHDEDVDFKHGSYPGAHAKKCILEVGCGVGNTVFPILQANNDPNVFVYCCDFSKNAVSLVKEHPDYTPDRCHSFVCDVTDPDFSFPFPKQSLDIIIMIFVLSAIQPDKMQEVISRLTKFLKPGGLFLFRDYGRYDLAQLRFKKGKCLSTNFYVRGDGTRVYFFTQDELARMFSTAGLVEEQNHIDRRLQVNRGRQLRMYRVWIQCKYRKPR